MSLIAIILIVVILSGGWMGWPRNGGPVYWGGGYGAGGLLGIALIFVIFAAVLGHI